MNLIIVLVFKGVLLDYCGFRRRLFLRSCLKPVREIFTLILTGMVFGRDAVVSSIINMNMDMVLYYIMDCSILRYIEHYSQDRHSLLELDISKIIDICPHRRDLILLAISSAILQRNSEEAQNA